MKTHLSKGFSLIEVIVTLGILAILSSFVLPQVSNYIEESQHAVDKANLRVLNSSTSMYRMNKASTTNDVFQGFTTDEQRMNELVQTGYLGSILSPQHHESSFVWNLDRQIWVLALQTDSPPLSPLGSTFTEISTSMINLIQQRYDTMGSYGRTWGDFAFTDIGLDPQDWVAAVGSIYYRPVGGQMRIRPEEGSRFVVNDVHGNQRVLTYALSWSLVYDMQLRAWYFHSVSENNRLNMATFEIQK
jgi:prepilin-type N-terminal cleavage/methylation domain-containing protein